MINKDEAIIRLKTFVGAFELGEYNAKKDGKTNDAIENRKNREAIEMAIQSLTKEKLMYMTKKESEGK